jgi:putative zinc finger/helix-turn-helix YgiT family protein
VSPEKDIRTGDWKYRIEGLTADRCQVGVFFYVPAWTGRIHYRVREEPDSMSGTHNRGTCQCSNCGAAVTPERRNYRFTESGLSNVILHGVEVADCPKCGTSDVIIPRMAKIHRAIAQALANSPARLTGEQLRFLRKHLGLSGDQVGSYLHTDRTKISKWENEDDRIGQATDRLIRLLTASLDSELRPGVSAVAEHPPLISDKPGNLLELHVDVVSLATTFFAVSRAA